MKNSEPWAKSILASINKTNQNYRLDTVLVRIPRIILAELNTHRRFSHNSASTRAVPTSKLIEQVRTDPFIPLQWGKNMPGMQAFEEITDIPRCRQAWIDASRSAADHAERLMQMGLHKQIAGRVLEPFAWTLVLISATEWDNFFRLRDHPDAEPHIRLLAQRIRDARDHATPQFLDSGEFHLPFLTDEEKTLTFENKLILTVARCASTSYKTVDGFDMVVDRARKIFDKLIKSVPAHSSPLEHIAAADEYLKIPSWRYPQYHRNFEGFRQYRAWFEDNHN